MSPVKEALTPPPEKPEAPKEPGVSTYGVKDGKATYGEGTDADRK